jgi:hypothetical protein
MTRILRHLVYGLKGRKIGHTHCRIVYGGFANKEAIGRRLPQMLDTIDFNC